MDEPTPIPGARRLQAGEKTRQGDLYWRDGRWWSVKEGGCEYKPVTMLEMWRVDFYVPELRT